MDTQELSVSPAQAAEVAKQDFNFLAAICMPLDFLFNFPEFFLALFHLLTTTTQKFSQFAIGIPRGFAKTTFLKVLCVWYVVFSNKHFILIISASEAKAAAILADVCDMLSGPNIRRLFGNWDAHMDKDDSVTKVFYFRGKEMIIWAAGAGTSVRGINRKNKRPDVMLMDDIQDREDAKNKELADALLVWMLSTLMKACSPFGCTYIFVGNMYPQNSILAKLKQTKGWISLVVGGILADGSSLWEALKPVQELLEEYERDSELGHPEIFISEVLNSTEIALASGIDPAAISFLPEYFNNDDMGEASFIVIDPSGGKEGGDDCTINHWEVKDSHPIFDELKAGTFSPLDTIKFAIEMGMRRNTRCIGVESGAYQSTLLFWFQKYCETAELNGIGVIEGFHFVELPPKGQKKNIRIKNGYTKLVQNSYGESEYYLHPRVRSLVVSEYISWNPLKVKNNDNIIDPIGYVEFVMQEYQVEIIRDIFDSSASDTATASHTEDIALSF